MSGLDRRDNRFAPENNPVAARAELAAVVPRVTGRPARTFAQWAADHAADFSRGRPATPGR